MRVAYTIGIVRVPPTYFAIQHAEKLKTNVSALFGLVLEKNDNSIKTPFISAVPGEGVLSFRKREYIEPLFLGRMSRQITAFNPEIIHQHFATWAIPAIKAAKKTGAPLLVTLHGADVFMQLHPPHTLMGRWHQKNYLAVNKEANKILPVSRYLADKAIESGLPASKIEVHYQGIDTDFFTPPPTPSKNEIPTVLHVGALSLAKGIPTLIKASNILKRTIPHKLLLVGDGPLKPEVLQAQQQYSHICYLGAMNREQVRDMMQKSDLFVLATQQHQGREEAAGLVTLEAQACGTPVVINRSGGAAEMLSEDVTGFTAERENPESLARQMQNFLSLDCASQIEMGKEAREFVLNERSLDSSCQRLLSMYHSLL